MTTSAGNSGFGHIYWRNPWSRTSFFVQCYQQQFLTYSNKLQVPPYLSSQNSLHNSCRKKFLSIFLPSHYILSFRDSIITVFSCYLFWIISIYRSLLFMDVIIACLAMLIFLSAGGIILRLPCISGSIIWNFLFYFL